MLILHSIIQFPCSISAKTALKFGTCIHHEITQIDLEGVFFGWKGSCSLDLKKNSQISIIVINGHIEQTNLYKLIHFENMLVNFKLILGIIMPHGKFQVSKLKFYYFWGHMFRYDTSKCPYTCTSYYESRKATTIKQKLTAKSRSNTKKIFVWP